MNIQRDERSIRVFPSAGSKDPAYAHAKLFADPFLPESAFDWTRHAVTHAISGPSLLFKRFAFQALPVFERGGLWISEHLEANSASFAEVWRIYDASFADSDKRCFLEQVAVLRHPRYRFSAIRDGDATVGVLGCWDLPGFCFVEHVAIAAAHRSSGYGSRAMRLLQQHLGGVVVLDVEPPASSATAARRVAFYERHGLHFDGDPVTLPPYAGKREGPSHLMVWPRALASAERNEALAAIRREIYGRGLHAARAWAV